MSTKAFFKIQIIFGAKGIYLTYLLKDTIIRSRTSLNHKLLETGDELSLKAAAKHNFVQPWQL